MTCCQETTTESSKAAETGCCQAEATAGPDSGCCRTGQSANAEHGA